MPVLTLLAAHWRAVIVLVVLGILGTYAGAMRLQRDAVRADYAEFRTKVAQAAEAAAAEALKHTIADEKRKEQADAEHAQTVADLAGRVKRLRDARPSGRLLSAAPACPASPEGAARYRAEYQRAYRDLVDGLRAEADRGSKAVTDLNSAKLWAK